VSLISPVRRQTRELVEDGIVVFRTRFHCPSCGTQLPSGHPRYLHSDGQEGDSKGFALCPKAEKDARK
jgi:hypothetical protein